PEPHVPLDRDQGADPLVGEHLDRADDLLDDLLPRRGPGAQQQAEHPAPAGLGQGPPELGLEEHDERQHPERPEVLQDERQAPEIGLPRQEASRHQEPQADEHLDRHRAPEDEQHPVDDERDDRDVDQVLRDAQSGQEIMHGSAPPARSAPHQPAGASRIASATRTARRTAPTSWTRRRCTPAVTATVQAASVPSSRSAGGTSSSAPMKLFRDGPTRIGRPSACSASSRLRSVRLWATVLPNPIPGSTQIASGATPAPTATSTAAARPARTSPSRSS